MKRPLVLALAAAATLFAATAAQAARVDWSIGVGLPPLGAVAAPVYAGYPAYPPPVVHAPRPVAYLPGPRVWLPPLPPLPPLPRLSWFGHDGHDHWAHEVRGDHDRDGRPDRDGRYERGGRDGHHGRDGGRY